MALCRVLAAATFALIIAGCGGGKSAKKPKPGNLITSDGAEYLAHEVIVKRRPGTDDAALMKVVGSLGGKLDTAGNAQLAAELGYVRVMLPKSVSVDEAIVRFMDKGVASRAERNYVVEAFGTPNDPRYGELWGMAKIGAPAGWNVSTGSRDIVVAVSDTGIDYTHPDLVANMWKNPGEIAGNGQDDDGNGYVDDVYGYDFANRDGDPRDDNGHGTHCAGTIGAVGNDGVGVAGVNWRVKLMGTKFLNASGSGDLYNGVLTVLYAAKMKARVVSASWGCMSTSCYSSYMVDALTELQKQGGIFIAAAGNANNNNDNYPTYPANYGNPNVIAVAASDQNDNKASFSSYGVSKVHIAAPGVSILSTTPNNGYASWNGTSMATPHVAGAAALLLAVRPDMSVTDLRDRLLSTVDVLPSLATVCSSKGRLNVQKLLNLDSTPPAAPTDVKAVPGDRGDITVSWAPNGETDLGGYRIVAIQGPDTQLGATDVAKDLTSHRFPSLVAGKVHYFHVTARDAAGNSSPQVTVNATPIDNLAPPQVVNLAATAIPGAALFATVTSASGQFSDYFAADKSADGNPDTAWISPARAADQEENVVYKLGTPYFVDRVELMAPAAYPEFFPIDFDIDVSADGTMWETVAAMRGASAQAKELVTVAFKPTWATLIRIRVVRAFQHESGMFYSGLAELVAREISKSPDGLRLTFTAPGDDPGEGAATSYDLRASTDPIDETNFAAATALTAPKPSVTGTIEVVQAKELRGDTKYYVALKAIDDAGNVSPLSNVATAATLGAPPSTITDLRLTASGSDWLTLDWTAPGEDGTIGTATSYEMRVSTTPLSPANFTAGTPVPGLSAPQIAGAAESFSVTGLEANKLYYFAIRAIDRAGSAGFPSNVVAAEANGGPDNTPPATVIDLATYASAAARKLTPKIDSVSSTYADVYKADHLIDGLPNTSWVSGYNATAIEWVVLDLGTMETVSRFRMSPGTANLLLYYPTDFEIQGSIDKQSWTTLVKVSGQVGVWAKWNEYAVPPTPMRYVRIYTDKRGPAGVYISAAEIELHGLTPELEHDLTFVAPGDDGYVGTAARYELRSSSALLTAGNFAAATLVPTLSPLRGGMLEVAKLPALPVETTRYYGLVAFDDAGNAGGLSNVVKLETPGVAPSPVTDLAVLSTSSTSAVLQWTATGDDAMVGMAAAYDLRFSKQPLHPANWNDAAKAATPIPQAPGQRDGFTITGLDHSTRYYFGLKVVDDRGNESLISNLAAAETADGTPPADIADLVAVPVDPRATTPIALTVSSSTGAKSPETDASKMLDANQETAWFTPSRGSFAPDDAVLKLDGKKRIGAVRLRAATGYADRFPPGFDLEVRGTTGGAWTKVVTETSFVTTGAWEQWQLGGVEAVEARLVVTKTLAWAGLYYAVIGDLELLEDHGGTTRVRLSWTATGDDDDRGTATRYDLRRASTAITEGTFASATVVAGAPVPHAAGTVERLEVTGLQPDTTYCFAVIAFDDVGHASKVAGSPCVKTPGLPPSAVVDLRATGASATALDLSWTAPGADGTTGTATKYELRYALSRINDETWADATVVADLPAPRAAGSAETFKVTGLAPLTVYHFALKATDQHDNVSPLSNVASARTLDGVPPSNITTLVATAVDPQETPAPLPFTVWLSTGYQSEQTHPKYLLDANAGTAWFSPMRPAPLNDSVYFRIDAKKRLGAVRMRAATGYADRFPRGFDLEVRSSSTAPWVKVVAEGDFTTTGGWEEWKIGAVEALEARLTMTRILPWAGYYYAVIADLQFIEESSQYTRVRLSWAAPGDDGEVGTAARYDVRHATAAITDATFAGATVLPGAPKPGVAGTIERLEVAGLLPETKYCFAAIAYDDVEQPSKVGNSPCVTTPGLPPSTIVDLRAGTATATSLALAWTAPGADGTSGTAARYELRHAAARITAATWDQAKPVMGLPAPRIAGTAETFTVTGLQGLTTYFFAVRAVDAGNNAGAISNIVSARTADDVAPGTVADLKLTSSTTTSAFLSWTAPGDNGPVGTATKYDLRVSTAAITDANFASAASIPTGAPAAGGTLTALEAKGLAPESTYHFALKTIDGAGNVSALSNVVTGSTKELAPAQVTDLTVISGTGGATATVVIQWTAPGDDGTLGTASRYDIRHLVGTLTAANFATATAVTPPTPATAGTTQQLTITGLVPGKTYQIGVIAYDDRNIASPLSNVVTTTALDEVAPSGITNLAATKAATNGSVALTWTAPGDDGATGTAKSYDLRWSKSPISDATFSAATALTAPAPIAGGATQSFTATGLPDETAVYFALKARDDVGNTSVLSNVAETRTADVAPAAVTTLKQSARAAASVTVTWTAPGDDGTVGQAAAYDVRYSTTAITAANFEAASPAAVAFVPQPAGATETLTISGLAGSASYHVALKTRDERGNVSGLSNVVATETTDLVAPGKITNLAAAAGTAAGSIVLTWTATGDNGAEGRATSYELRRATQAITDSSWATATPVTGLPAPKDAATAETFTATGLDGETMFHFAIRAVDESSNSGPVSNSTQATTASVPPGTISDLAAAPSPGTVTLSWTAPGDDGAQGQAKLYDVRYSKMAITAANFATSTAAASPPAPATAGTKQTFAIGGLAESTAYFFAIKTQDDVGAWSALSNVPTVKTPDLTAPNAPSSLGAAPGDVGGARLKLVGATASSTLGGSWSAANSFDDKTTTSWASAPRATDSPESLTVDLGAARTIDRVRLLPDTFYPALFPRDFTIEVSADNKSWTTVVVEEEFSTANAEWLSWGFPGIDARYVRLSTEETQSSHGLHYAIVAEVEVYAAVATDGRTTLSWIAPGDDGTVGTATSYRVYRHTAAFTEATLAAATLVPQTIVPLPAGSLQSLTLTGLGGETTYHWAVRAVDDAGNVGALSAVASGMTNAVAPAAIQDLVATAKGMTTVELAWTATGDDAATGKATSYEMRYATFALSSQNFPLGTEVKSLPAPATAGSAQTFSVSGLQAGGVYRFALLVRDEEGNASYLSNVAVAVTDSAADVTPPAAVTNLAARLPTAGGQVVAATVSAFSSEQAPDFKAAAVADGRRETFWASAARAASQEEHARLDMKALTTIDRIRIWPSATQAALFPPDFQVRVSPDGLAWTTVHTETGYLASPGISVDAAFTARSVRYVELRATALAAHANGLFYAVVAEIEPLTASEADGTALLSFTSPADNDPTGRAAAYDLRVGPCPFTTGGSTAVTTSAPLTAGSPELYKVTGLGAGTYCAAITSRDAASNSSALSNVAQFTVP